MAISPQQLKIYLTSAHRAVIFAIAQLSCFRYEQLTFQVVQNFCGKVLFVNVSALVSLVYSLLLRWVLIDSQKHDSFVNLLSLFIHQYLASKL